MSANRSLPTTPLEPIPAGADVRDIRPWLNRMRDLVAQLVAETRHLNQRTRVPVVPPHNPTQPPIPLQVYLSGGYICVRAGHHVWFDSYANAPAVTDLEKDVGDAWQAYTTGARTVYVKRVFNSDGTATVTLENTADNYATVAGGITNTEARWILATIADGVITQWRTSGDIDELRVA